MLTSGAGHPVDDCPEATKTMVFNERAPAPTCDEADPVRTLAVQILDAVVDAVQTNQREKGLVLLLSLADYARQRRPMASEGPRNTPFAAILAPVGELCRGKNDKLVIRTSGENPPQWEARYKILVDGLNRQLREQKPFLNQSGRQCQLSELPISEMLDVLQRILTSELDLRFRVQELFVRERKN